MSLDLKLIVYLLVAIGIGGWHFVDRANAVERARREVRAEYEQAKAEANVEARRLEQRRVSMVGEVDAELQKRKARARAGADRSRVAIDRLRQLLAERGVPAGDDPATAIRADDTTRLGIVVRDCATAIGMVAEAADSCEARLSGLQDYVRSVLKP